MIGRSRTCPASASAALIDAPARPRAVGEVDEQDRVLRDQPHQHDHADDREDVERRAGEAAARGTRR